MFFLLFPLFCFVSTPPSPVPPAGRRTKKASFTGGCPDYWFVVSWRLSENVFRGLRCPLLPSRLAGNKPYGFAKSAGRRTASSPQINRDIRSVPATIQQQRSFVFLWKLRCSPTRRCTLRISKKFGAFRRRFARFLNRKKTRVPQVLSSRTRLKKTNFERRCRIPGTHTLSGLSIVEF